MDYVLTMIALPHASAHDGSSLEKEDGSSHSRSHFVSAGKDRG